MNDVEGVRFRVEQCAAVVRSRVAELERSRVDLRAAVVAAAAVGVSEVQIAKLARVPRSTVRSWLGKNP